MMDLHLYLSFEPALLNHRLREANAPTVSYSDKGCFHDYNVITLGVGVKTFLRTPNACVQARFQASPVTLGCVPGEPGCLLVRSASVPNSKHASSMGLSLCKFVEQVQFQLGNSKG